jgi:hypothetical protein
MQVDTRQNSKDLASKIQDVQEKIAKFGTRIDQINNELDLEKIEIESQALVKQLGDLLIAQKVQQNLEENSSLQDSAKELVHHLKKKP